MRVVLRNPHAAPSAPRHRKTVAAERPEGPGLHGRRLMMALRRQTLDGALTVLLTLQTAVPSPRWRGRPQGS